MAIGGRARPLTHLCLDEDLPHVPDYDPGGVNGREDLSVSGGLCVHLHRLISWPSSSLLESKLISNPTSVRRSLAGQPLGTFNGASGAMEPPARC